MSSILRKYRRRIMRRSGMLPRLKTGRRRPSFKAWTGVLKNAIQAFHEKQKSILEKLREEEQVKTEVKEDKKE